MTLRDSPSLPGNLLFHRITGHLFFLVLLIYSIVYAAERSTYVDSAWQFFQRVNNEGFCFPSQRYGVFLSQLPLFIAVKLHLPYTVLVYVFSTSYILLYYLIWYLCTSRLNNYSAGLAILFCTFMGVREGFIHPVTETQQCVIYSVLLYALLSAEFKNNGLKAISAIVVTLIILFVHPVGVFTAGFGVALSMVEKKEFKKLLPWSVIFLLLSVTLWRFLFPIDNYDAAIYDQLKGSSTARETDQINGAMNFLLIHFTHFYWLPELAGLIAIVWLTLRKDWMVLSLTIGGVVGYTVIAAVTFRNGDSSILLERAFLPAFFMVNLVIGGVIVNNVRHNKWIPILLVLFFMINGIRYINAGCLMYKKRVQYLDEIVQKAISQGRDKYVLSESNANMEKILVPWALGTETLLYSKFKYDKCVTITLEPDACSPEFVRLTRDVCLPVAELNPNYFQLSTNPYTELK